mmetsp:Transcript_101939/g.288640  ORF Transcript_101939/g.288640 Transcript_101939/m.288640 type:complete len:280 (-) Transcript_101939:5-844(-)
MPIEASRRRRCRPCQPRSPPLEEKRALPSWEMLGKDAPVPAELVGDPIMEFTMEPHDVLHIPRGVLHEAMTSKESSLHITVTVPTSDYCWGVQLAKHMTQTLHSGDSAPSLQKLCASSLSAWGDAGPGQLDDAALDAQIQEIGRQWLSRLRLDSVLGAFEHRMARTNEGQAKQFAQAAELRHRPLVTEGRRVRLMYGISVSCELEGDCATFTQAMDGQHLELKINRSTAVLIRSLTSKPQKVADLPCEDAFERHCVLQILHQQGVVQLFMEGAGGHGSS